MCSVAKTILILVFALSICLPCSAYCPNCHSHGGISAPGTYFPNGFRSTAPESGSVAADRPHPLKTFIAKVRAKLHPSSSASADCGRDAEPSCGMPAGYASASNQITDPPGPPAVGETVAPSPPKGSPIDPPPAPK